MPFSTGLLSLPIMAVGVNAPVDPTLFSKLSALSIIHGTIYGYTNDPPMSGYVDSTTNSWISGNVTDRGQNPARWFANFPCTEYLPDTGYTYGAMTIEPKIPAVTWNPGPGVVGITGMEIWTQCILAFMKGFL